MSKHEHNNCPRCQSPFECKVGSIAICQCMNVSLNNEERDFIKEQFDDCLCASCMQAMKTAYQNQLTQDKLKSILGVHYRPNQS